jgi:hypothetical protein
MGVVIEICVKYSGGRPRIRVTGIIADSYYTLHLLSLPYRTPHGTSHLTSIIDMNVLRAPTVVYAYEHSYLHGTFDNGMPWPPPHPLR